MPLTRPTRKTLSATRAPVGLDRKGKFMKDSKYLRKLRISVTVAGLLAWTLLGSSVAFGQNAGRNLVAEDRTEWLSSGRLGAAVVRLVETGDATGQVELDRQVFRDSGSLLAYLSAQPRSWFSEGILFVFSGKEAVARDFYNVVIDFSVSNDYDLFSSTPVSKPGLQDKVLWVVQSSVSPYLPTP